jgi:hypothetical protein
MAGITTEEPMDSATLVEEIDEAQPELQTEDRETSAGWCWTREWGPDWDSPDIAVVDYRSASGV